MRTLTTIALALAVGLAAASDDKKSIEGRYTVVSGEHDGKPVPADHVKGSVLVIDKDKMVGTDKDKKEFFGCKYTLDTSKEPWTVAMVSTSPKEGMKAKGIVKADGDELTICYALPGGETPTEFKAGEKQNCFKLKKVKK